MTWGFASYICTRWYKIASGNSSKNLILGGLLYFKKEKKYIYWSWKVEHLSVYSLFQMNVPGSRTGSRRNSNRKCKECNESFVPENVSQFHCMKCRGEPEKHKICKRKHDEVKSLIFLKLCFLSRVNLYFDIWRNCKLWLQVIYFMLHIFM